ncbi:SDR family oxidoreductase [Sphaerisporangium sp. TRM90804]|uniref:SDR family oxidoreductase n=1 Tax=Sphaerisporangium sp. TRM90804 TaxID=3031113 RepID=UPI00244733B1|nr:SDR family oxidoreductase [Sphaerisporangium sp. TRM90804]MDH2428148.1 SDR family oxidoreductase [Sphaerisporangium sp. TRM90804]
MTDRPLAGQVALVSGATRGGGRGIAVQLGAAGATVYVTGRSTAAARSPMNRPETIEQTAELVTAAGGRGIAVAVDHTDSAQVRDLVERLAREQDGRLDVLVNNVWGGDPLTVWDKPLWEQPLEEGLQLQRQAVHSHIITSWHALPLMVARRQGLVVEVTDGTADMGYRGTFFYDLAKASVIRAALAQAGDLRPHGVTALALTPGFLRSEAMLDHFGVTEPTWRDGIAKDPYFAMSETPAYVGRAVAALAADPEVSRWTGESLSSWRLAKEYGFADADGSRPDWGAYYAATRDGTPADPADYR